MLQRAGEGSAVSCYLQARQGLLELFPEEARKSLEVVFSGAESGKAQALVRPVPAGGYAGEPAHSTCICTYRTWVRLSAGSVLQVGRSGSPLCRWRLCICHAVERNCHLWLMVVPTVMPPVLPAAGQRRSLTGLEGSAANGQGWGITPLQRRARPQQAQQGVRLGAGLQLDPSALAAVASSDGSGSNTGKSSSGSSRLAQEPQTQWRPWSEDELQRGEAEAARAAAQAGAGSGLSGAFATTITQAYATLQAKAGRQVGIPPGAAWRAALRAAAACGAQQVCSESYDVCRGS